MFDGNNLEEDLKAVDKQLSLLIKSEILHKAEFYDKLKGDDNDLSVLSRMHLHMKMLESTIEKQQSELSSLHYDLRALSSIIMNINKHLEKHQYAKPNDWYTIQSTLNKYGAY